MQKDSTHFSTSGNLTHSQAAIQESPVKSLQCCRCSLLLKSKVYLFEHLNEEHGMDVDTALREAGLKHPGTDKTSTDNNSDGSGDYFECQHCDFKACSRDVLNEHEEQCQNKAENQTVKGNVIGSENLENNTHSTDQHKEAAGAQEISSTLSVMSTSKTKCTLNSSKDLKTYKRTLQTITTYFTASPGSNKTPPVKSADTPVHLDSTQGTLILQESPSDSSPNSSGVFKVTAKPMIDISKPYSTRFLLDDHLLVSDLRPAKVKEQIKEAVSNNTGKRLNNESLKHSPAKKAKTDKEETEKEGEKTNTNTEQTGSTEYSFEFSEDEEENKDTLVNGDKKSPSVYFCKHCDYSDVSIRRVSAHYQNDHPYVRYNAVYIQDRSDQSATFRCLECPVEFLSVGQLKKHYTENHPGAPNVFKMQSRELNLVYKCFVCPFITNALRTLKGHYKQKHPTHAMDNSLMYCRYSVTSCQGGPSPLNACEKALSPVSPQSPKSACAPANEIKNAPSPQHPTSKGQDVTLYHCNNCNFNNKSAVVMQVHYHKCHPKEAVTIDKIKQSARITSHTASQMTPDKPPNSVTKIEESIPQKNISEPSMETRNKSELSQQNKASLSMRNPENTPEASKTHPESAKTKKVESAEDTSKGVKLAVRRKRETSTGNDSVPCTSPNKLFYCQFCCYSSTNIKSVVGHHNAKHANLAPTDIEGILCYSAKVQKNKLKAEAEAEAEARTSSSNSKTPKKVGVCGEELQHKEDAAADAPVIEANAYAHAENLFYCPKCNYGNPSANGVLCHQGKMHQGIKFSKERVIEYTALIRDEIKKSKAQAKETHSSTYLPLPLMLEGDEDAFFCHFCNYRHSAVQQVLRHYLKKHRGFMVKGEEVCQYTSVLLKWAKTSHARTTADQDVNHGSPGIKGKKKKKTKELDKVSVSPLQTQRILQCHRCPYSTEYVNVLRRHMWKSHKANRSVMQVLRVCFQQGALQTGYHCDVCVFSHKKAEVVYKHYQKQHPGRILNLEYVTSRLYVSPETCSPKKKKKNPQIKRTDGIGDSDGTDSSLPSQRSGQNETKVYSCRACSFKGRSMTSITNHYRAVHPWSVKEDGSVLDVRNSKKQSGNRQVEDHNEIPVSFDSYQVPLEFDNSPGSPHGGTVSSTEFKCPYCSLPFTTQHGLRVHCGMKHLEHVTENLYEQQEQHVQTETRLHVFKCPHCTYVNTNYQGVLTHCQMRHPALESKADSLYMDETQLHNLEDCLKRNGADLRLGGYMCKTCPQIYATLKKLNKHCKKDHDETLENTAIKKPESTPNPSAVVKKKLSKAHSHQVSVSKASFLSKKKRAVFRCQQCSYGCTTKLGLSRHVHFRHNSASVSEAQDSFHKCALCSRSYSMKKHLGSHYKNKHGKEAFLKYYAPYKQVLKTPAPTVPDFTSTQQPENTSEACESSMTAEKNKIFVYKCPNCPYVNASYHGTLTHCQMQHPDVIARADELETGEILVSNMVRCKLGKSSNERGYMCKKCPQIHVSLNELKIHCEKDHNQGKAADSELSAETETKKQPDLGSESSVLVAGASENKTSTVEATEIGLSLQLDTPETCQSSTPSAQKKESQYKCHVCTYTGSCRKYLHTHYRNTHKFDQFTTRKLLAKYNKRNKSRNLLEAESEESTYVKCKLCPDIMFDSSQLLIAHYSAFHSSDSILDFTVLTQASKKTTGLYKCSLCEKQINGIKMLCHHLDSHWEKKMVKAAKTSLDITTTPEATPIKFYGQGELPIFETVDELAQWNATPVETFTLPTSPLSSLSQPTDVEQPELESREDDKHTCKQCRRSFKSLKGLRSHERSHAALAAIKKLDVQSTSTFKHNINKYVLYKDGTMRPFLCSFCNYRTTVMGLWRSHVMRKHQEVFMGPAQTDNQTDERAQRADEETPNSSEELNNLAELDEDPDVTERSLYSEPPDVQRQLAHYSLMAQGGDASRANVQETMLPDSVLHCELCNFNTEHLSSMRRHYLNRHGKKILRCKDCEFFTGLRKTLEMHVKTGHSTCQSETTHQKDLHCPFCLYQTKNKNNMIDHIVLHREERVVPIEVRRPKLSRYLRGIVFRCHKCTFTSGSAENLRLHMTRHDDVKPYKCRLCYFDCTQLNDLEAHLSDKHQVLRNHELVGQISLDQLEARAGATPEEEEEPLSNSEHHDEDSEDVKTEEFHTDCNEVPHETQAENLGETTLQIKERCQQQGQNGMNGDEETPAKSPVSDLQYENTKSNTSVQERHEQDPQEPAEIEILPDTERGQRIENTAEQTFGERNNADIQHEDISRPEKERQANENQTVPKHRHNEDSSLMLTQHKEEAAEGSSTYGKRAEKAHPLKLQMKALKQRTLNIEASIEDDILRHILLLDEDGSIRKIHKRTDQDRTVKTEQDTGPEALDNSSLLDKGGSITSAHSGKNQVNTEAISASAKINRRQANIRTQERFTLERHLLSLTPNCGQFKMSSKEILGVSFTNCREKQVQNQKNSEEGRDPQREMPVLEHECLKEEMGPLDCCKEEDASDRPEQNQDAEDGIIAGDDENQSTHQEHQESDGIKDTENPHVPKGGLTVPVEAPAEEKLFACELCGRNLKNSSELERHIIRHRI